MGETLLIFNAGSSSLKFSAFAADDTLDLILRGQVESISVAPQFTAFDALGREIARATDRRRPDPGHDGAIRFILDWLGRAALAGRTPVAAGHRVVHGGTRFSRPALVDPEVLDALQSLVPLAPLHQPHNLSVIQAVSMTLPDLKQVACFDTAFHRTQPEIAHAYAIPRRFSELGVQRYGFHGLSYEFIANALPALDPTAASGRTIVAHLGSGASMCAMRAGRSIATTMGFSTLDGLVMGTRCGSLDPGVVLYLHQHSGLSIEEIQRVLYQDSGLLGVSGISGDMRELLASREPRAQQAVDLFTYRASREIGSLAAALQGLDSIVFTGGIGEHAPSVRAAICNAGSWLGIELDPSANAAGIGRISTHASRVSAWVIPTNEELMIARHTLGAVRRLETP